jgi:Subtilase family
MNQFPHITLQPPKIGVFQPAPPFNRKKSPTTQAKLNDRWGHGTSLKHSVSGIVSDWQQNLADREKEQKPRLPDAIPLILQIDSDSLNAEELRQFGIEVICELENGQIIGASADVNLTKLQEKLDQFINEKRGGGKVAEVWEIIDGIKKPECILSPQLESEWGAIQDVEIYIIDVGIACLGDRSDLTDYPQTQNYKNTEAYKKAIVRWMNKREKTFQSWDEYQMQREEEFEIFIQGHNGYLIDSSYNDDNPFCSLPDSFTCRISIPGAGLRDLVLNFPYVFDVSLAEDIGEEISSAREESNQSTTDFILESPDANACKVCVIDSGIQEKHPLLRNAIATNDSKSWVHGELTPDFVKNGGHGTRVSGAILYPQSIPINGQEKAVCWIQNAKILNNECKLPKSLLPPLLITNVVNFYRNKTNTRIFNHSINSSIPCRIQYMSPWAATIDNLTWKHDLLFIVSAGNLTQEADSEKISKISPSIQQHIQRFPYPDYLLSSSCRVADPGQSFQALTVGSVSLHELKDLSKKSVAAKDHPSAFSRTGLGIWESIKPEVVEYGGDLVADEGVPPSFSHPSAVCPELVRSTVDNGPLYDSDTIGTSFAAPKVAHIAARLANEFPNASCLLYRAMIVQSARLPNWVKAENFNLDKAIRLMGYGIPNIDRALGGASNRITLTAEGDGENQIAARKIHIYQVTIPYELRSPGEDRDILVEITLSYKAQPRRTRRSRRKYLSTWLHWECSKKGEDPECFLERLLKDYDAPIEKEKGESMFDWTLGQQKNWGKAKELSRQAGTIQKDWTTIKSFDLRESFCIAVVGHEGWNNDPNAAIPYALAVTFEATEISVPIYAEIASIQVPVQVETEVSINL